MSNMARKALAGLQTTAGTIPALAHSGSYEHLLTRALRSFDEATVQVPLLRRSVTSCLLMPSCSCRKKHKHTTSSMHVMVKGIAVTHCIMDTEQKCSRTFGRGVRRSSVRWVQAGYDSQGELCRGHCMFRTRDSDTRGDRVLCT